MRDGVGVVWGRGGGFQEEVGWTEDWEENVDARKTDRIEFRNRECLWVVIYIVTLSFGAF